MQVHKAYRYELDPNAEQLVLLRKSAGCARFAYNWGLARRKQAWQEEHRTVHAEALHRELNALKATQFPWLYEVSKCAPQEALRDLERAFENFFKGRARYPKFKKKGEHDAFRLTGSIHVLPRAVQLPRLGQVPTKESTQKLRVQLLSATVSREADRWFVSLAVETEIPDPTPPADEPTAVDLGLTDFAVFPDGEKVDGPKPRREGLSPAQPLPRPLDALAAPDLLPELEGCRREGPSRWRQQRQRARHRLVDQGTLPFDARDQARTLRLERQPPDRLLRQPPEPRPRSRRADRLAAGHVPAAMWLSAPHAALHQL